MAGDTIKDDNDRPKKIETKIHLEDITDLKTHWHQTDPTLFLIDIPCKITVGSELFHIEISSFHTFEIKIQHKVDSLDQKALTAYLSGKQKEFFKEIFEYLNGVINQNLGFSGLALGANILNIEILDKK